MRKKVCYLVRIPDQEQKEEETTDVEIGDEEPKGLMARRD
jgi:hypothetical protein